MHNIPIFSNNSLQSTEKVFWAADICAWFQNIVELEPIHSLTHSLYLYS